MDPEDDDIPFADPAIRTDYEAALGQFILAFNEVDYRLSQVIRCELSHRGCTDLAATAATGPFAQRLATLEILAATGAVRLQRVATEELAVAGGRRRRRSSTLTPQEQRVVDLAAAGLTNGEIGRRLVISAKTVEHHLSSSYTKLSIRSRRELMTSWQRTDDPAPSEADGKRS